MRHGLDPEVPEQLGDRVVAECPAVRRGEDQAGSARELSRFVQDLERARGERDPVIALRLHAARGDRPGLRIEIDLVPSSEPNLAGPAGRQHQELECQDGARERA